MNLDALPARLAEKIQPEPNTGCFLWRGAISSSHRHDGYGSVHHQGSSRQAHVVVWEHLHGPLPPETPELDHVKSRGCCSTLCVNDAHLEPVTRSENNRRSTCHHHAAFRARKGRAAMQREHDVGIGLALAWAREDGWHATARNQMSAPRPRRIVGLAYFRDDVIVPNEHVDRGTVVRSVPLTDTRVAFGIAMAKRGPWLRVRVADGVGNLILKGRACAYVQHSGGMHVRIACGIVDLDPRRWPQRTSYATSP